MLLRKIEKRIPVFNDLFSIQWHITDRCSLDCLHCYRKEKKEDLDYEKLLIIFEKIKRFLKEKKYRGRIHFAGGEPILSPHIFSLLKIVTDEGIGSRILTSGVHINDDIAIKIKSAGGSYVQISIEGDEETNDKIRGRGTFRKAINGAKSLKNAGIEVTFAMVVSKINLKDIYKLVDVGRDIAKRFYFSRLVPVHEKHFEHVINQREWKEAMKAILNIDDCEVVLRDPTFRPLFISPRKAHQAPAIAGCSIGYNSIAIESNGDVYPCRRLPIVIGNLLESELSDIWNSEIIERIRNRDNLKGKCSKCAYKWLCGGCRGIAYALKDDFLEEDPQCPFSLHHLHKILTILPAGGKKSLTLA